MAAGVLERGPAGVLSGAAVAASTIFALSSGRPPAGIAVVRVSGAQAFAALASLTGRALPPPRLMALRTLRDPISGTMLDRALVVRFVGTASATGEELVELHLHGGAAVIGAALAVLAAMPGFRLAEPGEFTRRAFDNGKLDLSQVEGLADLIDAQTEAQRRQALEQARGGLRERVERWTATLLAALAEGEAGLDFAEEEADVVIAEGMSRPLRALRLEIEAELAGASRGERLRDGLTVAIVGLPNVGKSSLINALAQRDAAIVTEYAGTTRDVIEVALDLDGLPVTLFDTAGLRKTFDPVEAIGVARGIARAASADLVLHVVTAMPDRLLGKLVVNKIDISGRPAGEHDGALHVSAREGDGMTALSDWLAAWARAQLRPLEPVHVTRMRQRDALQEVIAAIELAETSVAVELYVEALRLAARGLGRISGRTDVDAILEAIFARFCIGK